MGWPFSSVSERRQRACLKYVEMSSIGFAGAKSAHDFEGARGGVNICKSTESDDSPMPVFWVNDYMLHGRDA